MSPAELDEIRARLGAATPGPTDPAALLAHVDRLEAERAEMAEAGECAEEGWAGIDAHLQAKIEELDEHRRYTATVERERDEARAMAPRWVERPVDGAATWSLRVGRALLAGSGISTADGVAVVMTNADMKTHPTIDAAARAVCARLGLPYIEVPIGAREGK